jgi:hypothetical protein
VGNRPTPDSGYVRESAPVDEEIREWWQGIKSVPGKFQVYAFFFILPGDDVAIEYFRKFGNELKLIAEKDCLVIGFSAATFADQDFDQKKWEETVSWHVNSYYCKRIANRFKVKISEFPCLMLFKDIDSPDYIKVSLKGMNVEEIKDTIRLVFDELHEASKTGQDPLAYLEKKRKDKRFKQTGRTIISEIRSIAGKTLAVVIEAIIKANVK